MLQSRERTRSSFALMFLLFGASRDCLSGMVRSSAFSAPKYFSTLAHCCDDCVPLFMLRSNDDLLMQAGQEPSSRSGLIGYSFSAQRNQTDSAFLAGTEVLLVANCAQSASAQARFRQKRSLRRQRRFKALANIRGGHTGWPEFARNSYLERTESLSPRALDLSRSLIVLR